MDLSIHRLDFEYYSYFSKKYKQQIEDIVIDITGYEPRYIFASSFGYISIIFDKEQYDRIIKYKVKIIDDILKYTDKMKKRHIGNIYIVLKKAQSDICNISRCILIMDNKGGYLTAAVHFNIIQLVYHNSSAAER